MTSTTIKIPLLIPPVPQSSSLTPTTTTAPTQGQTSTPSPVRTQTAIRTSGPLRTSGLIRTSGPIRTPGAIRAAGPIRTAGPIRISGPIRTQGLIRTQAQTQPPIQTSPQVQILTSTIQTPSVQILAPTIQTPTSVQILAPIQTPAPVQILAPIQTPATSVQILTPMQTATQIQAPSSIAPPARIQTQTPIPNPTPVQMQVASPIQTPTLLTAPTQIPTGPTPTSMQTPTQGPTKSTVTPNRTPTLVAVASSSAIQKIVACWLCGLIRETKGKQKSFDPLWGSTEGILKKQNAAKILLAEDGKASKDFVEGDCVCQSCGNQIHRRICIMEGKPFVSLTKKQKPTKKKPSKWISDDTSSDDDDISILDSKTSEIFASKSSSRTSASRKRKSSDTTSNVSKNAKATATTTISTKTGRTVKAPDRFSETKNTDKDKSAKRPNKTMTPTPKGRPIQTSTEPPVPTSPPKHKVSSVSSLDLSSIFGDDNSICVEVCIDNVQSAVSAFKGGARRIELCSSLSEGGLTPTCGFLREVKSLVKIPVFVMIRPRGGDFLYSDGEVDVMKYDIKNYKHNGADGFVFGVLDKNGNIDVAKCRALMQAAEPLPCTFHRAFDYVNEPLNSLETVIKLGFTRILTSGQRATAAEGIPLLKKLVEKAAGRISIMAGAGINPQCVGDVVARTGVREVHGSARMAIKSQMKKDEKNSLSMGLNPADDFSLLVTNHNAVAQIVKAAEDALEAGKLITIL